MKLLRYVFTGGYLLVVGLFIVSALALVVFAAAELWQGVNWASGKPLNERFNAVLESIGLLTIAVAALELGQTILEEEVTREAQMSAPTRVRRFLSRFMVVVIVSLGIETLVAVFQLIHEDATKLPHAASVGVAAALMLAGWGVFIKLNKSAEEIEPEEMERAKSEDRKLDADKNTTERK